MGTLQGEKAEPASAASNVGEYSVSELSFRLKRVIEGTFEHIRVRGEIGRVSRPASGHVYLDLKDERAVLAGVIWKGVAARLRIQPEQGLEVVATGRLTTFPGQSRYQIVIDALAPAGVGALMALLEERRKKLAKEGLFADERKRALPFLPGVIGIVTSPSGAVIRDMMHGFTERFPAHVIVWPVRVQGETSAAEVAAAVRGFNALDGRSIPRPDVLIVARGGGSLEDLWGFNEEVVVRAVAESTIPVISAVGHETDWTLIDLVADARAPTPTKAAEWAVPKHSELIERLGELGHRQRLATRRALEQGRTRLEGVARGLPRPRDLVGMARQRLDSAAGRLGHALLSGTRAHAGRFAHLSGRLGANLLSNRLQRARERIDGLAVQARQTLAHTTQIHRTRLERSAARLRPDLIAHRISDAGSRVGELDRRRMLAFAGATTARHRDVEAIGKLLATLSYQGVLARGFALVRDTGGNPVRRAGETAPGAGLEIEFADGRIDAEVVKPCRDRDRVGGGTGAKHRPSAAPAKNETQGDLF